MMMLDDEFLLQATHVHHLYAYVYELSMSKVYQKRDGLDELGWGQPPAPAR
jgi:hypothetical protein